MVSRGRPIEGVEAKRNTSVTLTPSVWREFREIVYMKLHISASRHLEAMMKQEIQKLRGNEASTVDVEALQKQRDATYKKILSIQRDINKRVKRENTAQLIRAYKMDFNTFTNITEAIRQMLTDKQDKQSADTPVHDYLEHATEMDLALLITFLELRVQEYTLRTQIVDAQQAKYLGSGNVTKAHE